MARFNYQDFYGNWHSGAFRPAYDGQTDVYNYIPMGNTVPGYCAAQLVIKSDITLLPFGGLSAHASVTVHG